MSRTGWALVMVAWWTVGCGGREEPRDPAPAEPPAPEVAPAEEPAEARSERPRAAASEERAALQRQIDDAHRLLREARRQLRLGQTERGIGTLRDAIRAHPLPTAQCELGWALFQQSQPEEARSLLAAAVDKLSRQARLGARERNTLGACLYNLGRLEEQAQDVPAAIDAYRRSLALRDNRVVRSRLDALAGGAPPPPADCAPMACDGPLPTLEAAMERARAELEEEVERPTESELIVASQSVSAQPAVHAATFAVRTREWGGAQHYFVGVQTDAGWYSCEAGGGVGVGDTFGGAGEIFSTQIIPGGAPELYVQMSYEFHGSEEGINNTMGTEEMTFVGIEEGRAVVYGSVLTGDYYEDGMWVGCDAECEAEGGFAADCCEEVEDTSSSTFYELVDGPAGRVRFRLRADSTARARSARMFEVSLRELRCAETPAGRSRL